MDGGGEASHQRHSMIRLSFSSLLLLSLALPTVAQDRPSGLNSGLAWSLEHEMITRPLPANRSPKLASRVPTGTRTAPAESRSHLLERYRS